MNRVATHIVVLLSWKGASPGSPFLPGPGEARAPGWACNSLTVGFLINYLCHCVKCWKAGGVGEVCTGQRDVFSAFSDQYYCNNSLETFFPQIFLTFLVLCGGVMESGYRILQLSALVPCNIPSRHHQPGTWGTPTPLICWASQHFRNIKQIKTRNENS